MLKKLFKRYRHPKTADTPSADACCVPAAPVKGKVLVVDDDAIVRKTLNIKLSAAGYQVFEAPDGSSALTLAGQENPLVIIMDIYLAPEPGMTWTGFSLMKWLSRPRDGICSPFIVITGGDSADLRDKALAAGAAGFFQKPLDMPAMLAAIERLVASSSQPGAA